MQKTSQQYSKPTKQPHPNGLSPNSDTTATNRNNNRRPTNTTNLHHKWTLPSKSIGKPNSQKQHGTKPQYNGASPAPSANMTEAFTQILAHVTNNKNNDVSRRLMKNIKIFDGTNKAECITWLSQIEAAAGFSNKPFRELVCQHGTFDVTYSFRITHSSFRRGHQERDPNKLLRHPKHNGSSNKTSPTEPLVTFNHRYEAIHRVAFSLSPNEQYNKTIIVEYTKKLPQNTRDKLLRKIAKKNSYIRTLEDAFKQAIKINRETSFVEAASGCYSEQNNTRIDTQINKLDDSFQDCNINTMNTRATNRSTDGSHNGSFNRSGSRNSSLNSSYNSRPSYRKNSYSKNSDTYNRQGYNRDNNRDRGYQPNNRYDQKNQSYQNRYDNNQDRYRYDNRRRPNKYQHHRNQPKAQIIFEYSDQNMSKMLKTVRNFIDCMKANPATREQFKTNKLTACKEYNNEINKSEINACNLDQVQQLINEEKDIVFNTLVAADYIDEVDCTDRPNHQQA